MITSTIITLDDGRTFPSLDGTPLPWVLQNTWEDQEAGFPKLRAVIRAMRDHRPNELLRERERLAKDSFNKLFGHNAETVLRVVNEELTN